MTKLWYCIEGEREVFSVSISPEHSIHDLREKIKEERSNLLGVDAASLTLSKPKEPIFVTTYKDAIKPIKIQGAGLELADSVAKTFPIKASSSQQPDTLDIFIQLPTSVQPPLTRRMSDSGEAPLKRARLSDSGNSGHWESNHDIKKQLKDLTERNKNLEDRLGKLEMANTAPELSLLEELHSKIWNCGDKLPLFRKVVLTRARYDDWQLVRKEKFPHRDRTQPGGEDNNAILAAKLEFLESTQAERLTSQHHDNNMDQVDDDADPEATDEDDFNIDSFFPFTLNYLDLSSLALTHTPARFPLPFFIRQEYDHISKLIDKAPQGSQGSFIISGQPGTGKTVYLYFLIIKSLIAGRPFLYQTRGRTLYHVAESGIQAIRSWPSDTPIVAFVDGDRGDWEPQDFLFELPKVKIIVASSPKGANQKWLDQIGDIVYFTKLAMRLWSPQELFLIGIFLHFKDILPELLRQSTSYFGYNPRRCFKASYSEKILEGEVTKIKGRIEATAAGLTDITTVLQSLETGASDFSHMVFQLFPTDQSRSLSHCRFEPVSRWAFDQLLNKCEELQAGSMARFYRQISGAPRAATLRGHLFEKQVLNSLGDGSRREILGLTNPKEKKTWTFRGRIQYFTEDSTAVDEITQAVANKEPLHLVPVISNFPAVDSVVYEPDKVLTCIQVTIKKGEHPIAVPGLLRGLLRVQRWFNQRSLASLRPSKKKPWRFIFIVPSNMVHTFKIQRLTGDTKNEWAGKVRQYVVGWNV